MKLDMFSPRIPPAWLAFPYLKDYCKKTFTSYDLSKSIDPTLWDKEYRENVTKIVEHHRSKIDVKYSLNSYGYREHEYQTSYYEYDSLILTFGHSAVFGIGVNDENTWPRLLENRVKNSKVLNFGIPGASTDTVARLVACTVPFFSAISKNIKIVILWPQKDRREIFQENYASSWSPWKEPPYPEFILSIDDTSNNYNFEKNKLIVDLTCKLYNINVYTVPYGLYQQTCVNDLDPDEQGHRLMYHSILGNFT